MPETPYILYGMPLSLYTGKVRAYLIRRRIAFEERIGTSPEGVAAVSEKVGRFIIPVLETPEGEVWQDGSEIIDRLEERHPNPFPVVPQSPSHAVIAHLFALFGSEGLLRPAMHYRWNFDETNLGYIREAFMEGVPIEKYSEAWEAFFLNMSSRMRAATTMFGVNEETAPTVEQSYKEFLSLFNAHLEKHPFLLGDHPTVGDEAFYGPLFPHLGRDPVPARMMKNEAYNVFRWTERLSHPGSKLGSDLIDLKNPPETLVALLSYIRDEYLPDILAHIDFAENWLAEHPDIKTGESGVDKRSRRAIGAAEFEWRGHKISALVMPYRLWLLERMQQAFASTSGEDRDVVNGLFAQAGLTSLLERRVSRPVMREDNMEVWGAPRDTSLTA